MCRACWAAVHRFPPRSGIPDGNRAHARGRSRSSPIPGALAAGPYEGRLRDIIHAFKYDGRRTLARPLAALMRDAGGEVLDGADAAVPVPLHWLRRRRRGFNQAALLASGLGLPVCHALCRSRRTRAQAELPAGERHVNVAGAFALAWPYRLHWLGPVTALARTPARLDGLTVVLVDDVSTTGATLDACARVLVAAGVGEVRALTVARVAARLR
ncbi:MAG TPA: ComF family protein [Vicinamibacterales bacterium]|nr:ComF family protein [Vicinamibacterales bacterium]